MNHFHSIKGTYLLLAFGLLHYCDQPPEESPLESLDVQNISVDCVSGVLSRGPNEIVITTQEEYEQFLDWKFKQRMDGTWDYHFPNVLEVIKSEYPDLTEPEYVQLATDSLFRMEVLIWAKNCGYPDGGPIYGNPEIDFDIYTLLGARMVGGGCAGPDVDLLEAFKDENQMKYIFRIQINWYGHCSMPLYGLVWALVPRIPDGYSVEFDHVNTVVNEEWE